jgi:hypothetical protein
MPIQLCKFIKPVEEIQDKKDNTEQFDTAANQAMTQIAEQNDSRIVARDVCSRRNDQGPDDHLFDVTEYFLGARLDMLSVERKPPASGILHGFSLRQRPASEFQYNGSAIKVQDGGLPDFFKEAKKACNAWSTDS